MRIYSNYIKPFLEHPLNRKQKIKAIGRFLKWQFKLRIAAPGEIVVPFIDESKFIVKKGRTGLTGNLYCGLHEFNEMMFLLHFLRKEDVFFDVGANVGSYSILSAVCKDAVTYSFEPVPDTFALMANNKKINGSRDKWVLVNSAIGDIENELLFSTDCDTMNKVVDENYKGKRIKVPVTTLSLFCKKESVSPILLKVDDEGYDEKVIEGAAEILSGNDLKAIIIEDGSESIEQVLNANGLRKFSYDPFLRKLTQQKVADSNSLFIKDQSFCEERLIAAPKVKVLSYEI